MIVQELVASIFLACFVLVWREVKAEFMSAFCCLNSNSVQLRHYADMRITLDLDDGVKANYGKFGDLLDSVKAVTGGAGDE